MYKFITKLHPNFLIETVHSEFSGDIQVRTEFGRPRIWAGGIPQSGGIVTNILKKALDELSNPQHLLLGLGGGAILWEIHRRWPNCQITAIEIDPQMIRLARKYFHIDRIPNLNIINNDASLFVERYALHLETHSSQLTTHYDSILVDCYLGKQIPPSLETPSFLTHLSRLLSPSGIITFNRLYAQPSQATTQKFITTLQGIFSVVTTKPAYCNLIIIAKNTA